MNKTNSYMLGVMQGRLLPKYNGRYQAHPVGYWQDEFPLASNLGLDLIEFILDYNDFELNPLMSASGRKRIQSLSKECGVNVRTVCADALMEVPIHHKDPGKAREGKDILRALINLSSDLSLTDIVVPLVDSSSLKSEADMNRFVENCEDFAKRASDLGVNISLETDLDPQKFCSLLDKLPSERVMINYDIGNSASLGYDPVAELNSYGVRVSDVHIKDRKLGGGPVILGRGAANFQVFFAALKKFEYKGPFIMQAYRDDEGIEVFKEQLNWIKNIMNSFYAGR